MLVQHHDTGSLGEPQALSLVGDTWATEVVPRLPADLTEQAHGGLTALLTYKEAGAPSGQKSLPAAVFAQLQARLATASRFASSVAIQQWLREEFS